MIKIGVIGTGSMGRNHVRNICELPGYYEFVGFHDVKEENIRFIEDTYGIAHFDNVDRLIGSVDALVVAAPSFLHFELGSKIIRQGKHALIEKPITLVETEGKILCEKFAVQNKVLMVGHVERFNPAVTEMKKVIDQEGGVIALDAKRCGPFNPRISDTNVVFDLMIHDLDIIINYLYPHPVRTVDAKAVKVMSENNCDYAQAIMQFDTGIITTLLASKVTEDKIRTIDVHTRQSLIRADLLNKTLSITRKTKLLNLHNYTPVYSQETIIEKVILPNVEPLKCELVEFANAINQNRQGLTDGGSAVNALHYAELINKLCQQEYKDV